MKAWINDKGEAVLIVNQDELKSIAYSLLDGCDDTPSKDQRLKTLEAAKAEERLGRQVLRLVR